MGWTAIKGTCVGNAALKFDSSQMAAEVVGVYGRQYKVRYISLHLWSYSPFVVNEAHYIVEHPLNTCVIIVHVEKLLSMFPFCTLLGIKVSVKPSRLSSVCLGWIPDLAHEQCLEGLAQRCYTFCNLPLSPIYIFQFVMELWNRWT